MYLPAEVLSGVFYCADQESTPDMQEITRLTDISIKLQDLEASYNNQVNVLTETKELLQTHLDNTDDLSRVDTTLEQIDNITKEIDHVSDQLTRTQQHLADVERELDEIETRPE